MLQARGELRGQRPRIAFVAENGIEDGYRSQGNMLLTAGDQGVECFEEKLVLSEARLRLLVENPRCQTRQVYAPFDPASQIDKRQA
jgi:hypothetical protein